ncbi:thioredoxin [Saccharopolyspora sp. HNM0983]|uniref:Thioredoxin n=1 Tax=Saccharopolyspora montiporae TaxID=2781240 RepID=A0A929FYL2_9PSEU|nr:thioredoxin [Saccharopolyspora sp. HNM0983]MBE9373595.1 thioredoxin [Saccharopolyspora sp. HNM0983]
MAPVTLTTDNFEDVVSGGTFVIIDFWASWCGPCRMFAPVFERAADQHDDITFAKVDTEDQPELAKAFEVQSIPTLAIVREGTVIFQQAGALPEHVFEDLIRQAREVDMQQVRASAQ